MPRQQVINEAISEGMWSQSNPEFEACKVYDDVKTEKRTTKKEKREKIPEDDKKAYDASALLLDFYHSRGATCWVMS